MTVYEILITVSLTVAAAVAIAYTTFKLQARHRERALFRALRSEIEYNRLRLDSFIAEWSIWSAKKSHCPEAPILCDEAYVALRLSGELLRLPETVRNRLNNTLSLIAIHNLRVGEAGLNYSQALGHDASIPGRIDRIIKNLQVLEKELGKDVQKPTKRSDYAQQDLLQRYIMLQVPLLFFFGLLSIYAYYLAKLDTGANMSIWEWVQHIVSWALMPVGIASIAWAIILSIVGLNCKVPRTLKAVREKIAGFIMEGKSEPIVYVASLTVFGVSFAKTWADLSITGIGVLHLRIILGIALALILVFFVDNILRACRRRALKAKTKNNDEIPYHGA